MRFFLALSTFLSLSHSANAFVPHVSRPTRVGPTTKSPFGISKSPLQAPPPRMMPTSSLHGVSLNTSWLLSLHSDPKFCLTAILLLSVFGISLERRTTVGKALSAPLATMAAALLVANLRLVPFASPVYSMINAYLVPLAVPMLLFDSDLRRVLRDTGSMLAAFGVGALATVVGTFVAFPLVPMKSLGDDAYKVASALTARHIGGAINFVAVAETLRISGTAVSAAIAADNVVVALYFAMLFWLAGPADAISVDETTDKDTEDTFQVSDSELDMPATTKSEEDESINLSTLGVSLATSSVLVTLGSILTKRFLPGTSSLPLTSALTVVAATVFPKFFVRIRKAGTAVGILCIQMFFAASGASGSIALVLQQAPQLFLFSTLQIAVHFGVLVGLGRGILRMRLRELYLSSNANVGGPTTAAAMAQAKNWKRLVLPALLVGILGYATATAIALALAPILPRLPLVGGTV